ncbi:hypothetical protein WP50_08480 [Lactiplantibacillus plantarum]|nr:hypothetical protein WP50_08480 [Lactiplantibacillus plantarum]
MDSIYKDLLLEIMPNLELIEPKQIEQIGSVAFSAKYHVPVDGIKLDKETLKRIGLKGKYSSD